MRKSTQHYITFAEMAVDDIFKEAQSKQFMRRTLERKLEEFMDGLLMSRVPHSHKGYIAGYVQGWLHAFLEHNIHLDTNRQYYIYTGKRYS